MAFCSTCGKPLEENARFCSFCGAKAAPTSPTFGSKNIVSHSHTSSFEPIRSEKPIITSATEFCKSCGEPLEENARFCSSCGMKTTPSSVIGSKNIVIHTEKKPEPTETVPPAKIVEPVKKQETPPQEKASGALNIPLLIWSILLTLCCCLPLSIPSLILIILAKDADNAKEEAKKLKAAKICNWIGTIGYIIYIALSIVLQILIAFSAYI